MATIQKGAKINFYKFVPVTLASSATANPDDSNPKLTGAVLTNVKAVNNLGGTVNSLAKVVVDIKKITHASLTAEQKAIAKLPKPKYTKPAASFGNFFKVNSKDLTANARSLGYAFKSVKVFLRLYESSKASEEYFLIKLEIISLASSGSS